jgi:ATP-binding cassette subfamily F protein 3
MLGSFLFHGDDVFKKVSVLSGGEKSRLALSKMLLHPANLLIMDEPTNHLDMRSKAVLLDALREYDGTIVIVSHDRAFLDPLVNKVLEFTPGRMRTFLGTVSDYLQKKDEEEDAKRGTVPGKGKGRQAGGRPGPAPAPGQPSGDVPDFPLSDRERKRAEAQQRQKLYTQLKPLRARLAQTEKEIARMEKEKGELEAAMADPDSYRDGEEARNMAWKYHEVGTGLEKAYADWARITEKIDSISGKERSGR